MLNDRRMQSMSKVLGIFGAGGLGREYLETAELCNKVRCEYEDFFFVVDDPQCDEMQGKKVYSLEEATKRFGNNMEMALAVGEPESRSGIIERIHNLNIKFATLIHPSVIISETSEIGEGCYIGPFSFVSCNVKLGDFVLIQPHATIGHDCCIGSNVVISSMNALSGHVTVGDNTYIGVGSSVIQGGNIGKNSIIGMASVISRDIPDEVIAMGNPARAMKKNENHRVFG